VIIVLDMKGILEKIEANFMTLQSLKWLRYPELDLASEWATNIRECLNSL